MSEAPRWRRSQRAKLVEEIPCGIVVVDRSLTIVDHNRAFEEIFGERRGQKCFLATRQRNEPCTNCPASRTFADGQPRIIEQNGTDREGRPTHYLVQLTPVREGGEVHFVAATTTDLTATRRLQREYQTLFEKVPCYVAVINRDYRVVKANEMFRRVFGEATGEHCFALFKRRHEPCPECPAMRTFTDGTSHSAAMIGTSRSGAPTHYVVSTAPLLQAEGEVSHVIEMALDVTESHHLEQELTQAHILREALVETSQDAIVVLDDRGRIKLFNHAAEALWGYSALDLIGKRAPVQIIPAQIQATSRAEEDEVQIVETTVFTASGEEVPARIAAMTLRADARVLGTAVIAQDLSTIKRLEREKVDAERLAAVGQTVAGLAHGIKNILTGLEGGMYVTSTGLQRGDSGRTKQGWEMLERNIGRISMLVKNLLAFSRGEGPKLALIDPTTVVREVYELFRESAEQHGVHLRLGVPERFEPVVMDREGLHTCLANLVSNALDACLVSGASPCDISLRLEERANAVVFEVADSGCGMDYDVKQKVFTSFFSTKGAGGTGLGLLLTRKIVQQHGGTITFESTPGQGTVFRLSFPRDRLPRLPDHDGGASEAARPPRRE